MKIAVFQGHFPVGRIKENVNKIMSVAHDAKSSGIDLLVFPELALSGYAPQDLLFQADFKAELKAELAILIASLPADIAIVLGVPRYENEYIYNALLVLEKNKILLEYRKQCLPNFGVFDELRYFKPGKIPGVLEYQSKRIGFLICEDLWHDGPLLKLSQQNLDMVVVINASPFGRTKRTARLQAAKKVVELLNVPLVYAHQVGVQDEVIYDGASFYLEPSGKVSVLPSFKESLAAIPFTDTPQPNNTALIYQALCFALKSYVEHNSFSGVLVGLSGGIDSALTLAIAVDALGPEKVEAILMPSQYTATMSVEDAVQQAKTLRVKYQIVPIDSLFENFLKQVSPHFDSLEPGIAEENIQARLRGIILMALSNKSGKMVVATVNKSELAVGYGTLYGDLIGGYAVLKDVYKTEVYQLAQHRNQLELVIPERVLSRAPSAELREGQIDQDSLPDYAILDGILKAYIEENRSMESIKNSLGHPEEVDCVVKMIKKSEYKRSQSPVGPKVSDRALGKEWRMPIMSL